MSLVCGNVPSGWVVGGLYFTSWLVLLLCCGGVIFAIRARGHHALVRCQSNEQHTNINKQTGATVGGRERGQLSAGIAAQRGKRPLGACRRGCVRLPVCRGGSARMHACMHRGEDSCPPNRRPSSAVRAMVVGGTHDTTRTTYRDREAHGCLSVQS